MQKIIILVLYYIATSMYKKYTEVLASSDIRERINKTNKKLSFCEVLFNILGILCIYVFMYLKEKL